jgi:hypothetical protein
MDENNPPVPFVRPKSKQRALKAKPGDWLFEFTGMSNGYVKIDQVLIGPGGLEQPIGTLVLRPEDMASHIVMVEKTFAAVETALGDRLESPPNDEPEPAA